MNLFLLKWYEGTAAPQLSLHVLVNRSRGKSQTRCHGLAQGFPRIHNPFWPRHQSHILELVSHSLFLSGEPSDPGRINEQAYLDVTQHWRRSGLLTWGSPRSGLLGKYIRILHEYFHLGAHKITTWRSYSQIDFPFVSHPTKIKAVISALQPV